MKTITVLAITLLTVGVLNLRPRRLLDSSMKAGVTDPVLMKLDTLAKLTRLRPMGRVYLKHLGILRIAAQALNDPKAWDKFKIAVKSDPSASRFAGINSLETLMAQLPTLLRSIENFQTTNLSERDILAEQVLQHVQKEQTAFQMRVIEDDSYIKEQIKKFQESKMEKFSHFASKGPAKKPANSMDKPRPKQDRPAPQKDRPAPQKDKFPKQELPDVDQALEKSLDVQQDSASLSVSSPPVEKSEKLENKIGTKVDVPIRDVTPTPVAVSAVATAKEQVKDDQSVSKETDKKPKTSPPVVVDPITAADMLQDEKNAKNTINNLEAKELKSAVGGTKVKNFSFEHGGMMMTDSMTSLGQSLTSILGRRLDKDKPQPLLEKGPLADGTAISAHHLLKQSRETLSFDELKKASKSLFDNVWEKDELTAAQVESEAPSADDSANSFGFSNNEERTPDANNEKPDHVSELESFKIEPKKKKSKKGTKKTASHKAKEESKKSKETPSKKTEPTTGESVSAASKDHKPHPGKDEKKLEEDEKVKDSR